MGRVELACGLGVVLIWIHPEMVRSQSTAWETWELSGVIWCGDPEVWSVDSTTVTLPFHRMNASEAGTHFLWGCPASAPVNVNATTPWQALVVWEQALNGSNVNQSAVMWAAPPDTSAALSAEILAASHEAGWLDETGGVAAGRNGSDDPLEVHGPFMAAWELSEGCHAWSEPFVFNGFWEWWHDGQWKVDSWDVDGRGQTWVDTLAPLTHTQFPCLGIQVKHTSSNGDRWAFGWTPTESSPNPAPPGLTANSIELIAPDVIEGLLIDESSDASFELDVLLSCDDVEGLWQTLSPTPTLCNNTWQWTLPCSLAGGQSMVVQVSDLVDTLWCDGSGLLTLGDLAFTEIMADPTPAQYAPPSSYLEVLNVSELGFDPTALHLVDNDDTLSLEWVRPNDRSLVVPGECFLIADAAGPWEEFDTAIVVNAVGWSGLKDKGESIQLLGPDFNLVEDLVYFDDWWRDTSQDGHSLSCASPESCDALENWKPDPLGASPGKSTNLFFVPSAGDPKAMSLRKTPDGRLELQPDVPWDPRQVVILNLTSQTSSGVAPLAHAWDEEGRSVWETSLLEGAVGPFRLTIQTPPSCHADLVLADIDTLWAGHRSPQKGDLALTEILPSTHPILHSEFVEWTNVSNDTLDWKGCAWKPGACLVQSTHSLAHFQVWMGASWSPGDEVLLWEVLPGLSLTNDDGEVTLEDEWGNLLVSAEYSLCGHTDANGPSEGRSMECLPATFNPENPGSKAWQPAWRTSISQEGMSPGLATSWELSDAGTVDVNQTSWGVHEGAWVMTVPHHAPASWWAKDMWNPATEWVPFWHRGALMVRADHGPSVTQMGPVHLHWPELSFPRTPWYNTPHPFGCPKWNEVLLDPIDGHASFLEWETPEASLWTGHLHWSSNPNPDPQDFVPVSEVDWLLEPNAYPCFATCPNWVETDKHPCLSAHLPSLHGDRFLTLTSHARFEEMDLRSAEPSAWAAQEEGRSLVRIPDTEIWTSTPPPIFATPGESNGTAPMTALRDGERGWLECTPTIQPGGDRSWDVARMNWTPPQRTGLYHLTYGVQDPLRNQPLQAFEASWSSSPLEWSWKGTDENNLLVSPGPYVSVVQWIHDPTGKRGIDRCLVAVAPRR